MKEKILKIVREELEKRTWGVTEQFLLVHALVFEDGQPKIERIDTEKEDNTIIVYLPVKNEKFFLAFYLNGNSNFEIIGVGTEAYNSIYFRAESEKLNVEELMSMTKLEPTQKWRKGDKKGIGDSRYSVSSIMFEPNPEPDEFEDKIIKLLDFLEQDELGISRLVNNGDGYIQVCLKFHNGNTMLGGPNLDKGTINRLSKLNLSINFDLYAEGRFFKED